MKRILALFALILITLVGPACSATSSDIVAVTPLPQVVSVRLTATAAAPTPEAATLTPTAESTRPPTPTPLSNDLPAGQAAAIVRATDEARMAGTSTASSGPTPLRFDEFYEGFDMRKGLILTDRLVSLDGQEVIMEGYMAPPLKPELDFFVLTRIRLEFCPFCSDAADWPNDIAVVYMTGDPVRVTLEPVRVRGRLQVGQAVDPETGMISLVRIFADELEVLN